MNDSQKESLKKSLHQLENNNLCVQKRFFISSFLASELRRQTSFQKEKRVSALAQKWLFINEFELKR